MWIFAGVLGMGFGACRKAPPGADASREVPGAVNGEPAKVAGAASERVESRTTEQWLAQVLELGAMTDAAARKQALATLLAGMDNEARAAVLETLWALSDGAGRAVFAELFTLWCEGDPQTAAKWAVTLWDELPGREGEQLREQAGFAWAKRDFDAAFAWALTLRDVGSEWGLGAKILKELALSDPRRALELARGVSDAFYATAINRIFAGWVEHDPAAAFAELGVACKESSMFVRMFNKWAERDAMAALRWAMTHEEIDISVIHSLAGMVTNKGALVAAVYDARLDWSNVAYGDPLPAYFNAWIGADPARALVWLDALPDGPEKVGLITRAADALAGGSPQEFATHAASLIARLADAEKRRTLGIRLLSEWGRSDPEAALRWSLEMDDSALHEAALISSVAGLARLDVDAARAQVEALPPGPARAQANLNLAVGWSERGGAQALLWLNENQPDWAAASWRKDDDSGRVTLLRHALAADPAAVAAWANALPDQAPAQFLVGNAALQLGNLAAGAQPLKAAQALEALKPATRGMYLESARYIVLFGDHAAEARAYVERSTIFTAEEKAVLLKKE